MSRTQDGYGKIRETWGAYNNPEKQEPYPPFVALRDSGWLRPHENGPDETGVWWEAPAWILHLAQVLAVADIFEATATFKRLAAEPQTAGALAHLYEVASCDAMLDLVSPWGKAMERRQREGGEWYWWCEACRWEVDIDSYDYHTNDGRHRVHAWAFMMRRDGWEEVTGTDAYESQRQQRPRTNVDELAEAGFHFREGPIRCGKVDDKGRTVVTETGVFAPSWALKILRELRPLIPDMGCRKTLLRLLHQDGKKRGAVLALLDSVELTRRFEAGVYDAISSLTGVKMCVRGDR